mmetsp:Transcript_3959/g.7560  ORF Transcript_3959/g.7560 Transcript_3959/m.7560 type:complete len:156 (-) Transcript_3959:392-859(-)
MSTVTNNRQGRGSHYGGRGSQSSSGNSIPTPAPSILDLGRLIGRRVRVKLNPVTFSSHVDHVGGGGVGGSVVTRQRECVGTLRGYDELVNLVLDDVVEWVEKSSSDGSIDRSRVERNLGLVVCRGTQVSLVHPEDGAEEIANPFLPADDEEEDDS